MRPSPPFLQSLARRVDDVLAPHTSVLGKQYPAYRNHACRVAAFHCLLAGIEGEVPDTILVAAAYHDLGIWTARTFDYIGPSTQLAASHLLDCGCEHLQQEVSAMIRDHHKVTACEPPAPRSAEMFRRADWIDVTWGALRFGLASPELSRIRNTFPAVGFHSFLLRTSARWLALHPLNPLPMVRW